MPCIIKALIGWLILLVVSGSVGLFLRRGVLGILVPFPAASADPAVEAALRTRHYKRGHVGSTVFCFVVSAGYVWAVGRFWCVTAAVAASLMMFVVVEHYAQSPPWLRFTSNAVMWCTSVLVWYAVCKET